MRLIKSRIILYPSFISFLGVMLGTNFYSYIFDLTFTQWKYLAIILGGAFFIAGITAIVIHQRIAHYMEEFLELSGKHRVITDDLAQAAYNQAVNIPYRYIYVCIVLGTMVSGIVGLSMFLE